MTTNITVNGLELQVSYEVYTHEIVNIDILTARLIDKEALKDAFEGDILEALGKVEANRPSYEDYIV